MGNTYPFRPLKGRLSPYVRLSSRRSLLTLDGYLISPADCAQKQRSPSEITQETPDEGMVDFEGAFRVLSKVGYEGYLSVEIEAHVDEPDRGALESIQYLASI